MEKDSIKCYCSSCKQHTHHKVLAVYKRGSEPDDDYWWTQNLLPENRRLIKEDRTRFEAELKEKINNGEYSKLSLCPSPNQGQNQQYKIEAI